MRSTACVLCRMMMHTYTQFVNGSTMHPKVLVIFCLSQSHFISFSSSKFSNHRSDKTFKDYA